MKTQIERVYEWRANNLDRYNELQRLYQRKIYKENYDNVRQEQKKKYYQWKKQIQSMLNLLNNLVPL